jgi:hypothetical protein
LIREDPAAQQQLSLSAEAVKREQAVKSVTDMTKSKRGSKIGELAPVALSSPTLVGDSTGVENMFNPVRTSAQSMMEKFGKENEQKEAEEYKIAVDKAKTTSGNAEKKLNSNSNADYTLNDVVNRLDRLNMTMGQLLSQSEDLGKKQLRASKANSVQP